MMPPAAEPHVLLSLSAQICCAGVLIQSLEVLWNWRELGRRGLLRWTEGGPSANPAVRFVRALHHWPACGIILVGRVAGSVACLFLPFGSVAMFWALSFLCVAQLYYNRRFFLIVSNADSMFLIGLAALAIGALPAASATLQSGALCFLAGQVLVAYFVTGKNKLLAPTWRSGARLTQIMHVGEFRFAPVGALLFRQPMIALLAAWTVMVLQLSFPLSVFLPSTIFWIFIFGGLLFHGGIAFTMGLHDFFWSFVAAYPALWFVQTRIAGSFHG